MYEFARNDRFDSRDFFARVDPILKQQQFGGSLGGPMVSNKTFFFADYEGLRNTKGQVNNLTLPTVKMRTGDFSELLPTQIFDPTTSVCRMWLSHHQARGLSSLGGALSMSCLT